MELLNSEIDQFSFLAKMVLLNPSKFAEVFECCCLRMFDGKSDDCLIVIMLTKCWPKGVFWELFGMYQMWYFGVICCYLVYFICQNVLCYSKCSYYDDVWECVVVVLFGKLLVAYMCFLYECGSYWGLSFWIFGSTLNLMQPKATLSISVLDTW